MDGEPQNDVENSENVVENTDGSKKQKYTDEQLLERFIWIDTQLKEALKNGEKGLACRPTDPRMKDLRFYCTSVGGTLKRLKFVDDNDITYTNQGACLEALAKRNNIILETRPKGWKDSEVLIRQDMGLDTKKSWEVWNSVIPSRFRTIFKNKPSSGEDEQNSNPKKRKSSDISSVAPKSSDTTTKKSRKSNKDQQKRDDEPKNQKEDKQDDVPSKPHSTSREYRVEDALAFFSAYENPEEALVKRLMLSCTRAGLLARVATASNSTLLRMKKLFDRIDAAKGIVTEPSDTVECQHT